MIKHFPLSYFQLNLLLLLGPAGLLGFGYYLQYVQDLEPCPLCMTQRIFFYLVAFCGLTALFNRSSNIFRTITAGFGSLFSLVGLLVAGRQLWLQSLPEDQVPACGPGFDFIMETFPLMEAIEIMFRGNGNCAEVVWTFLGLSIPGWSFVAFSGLLLINLIQIIRKDIGPSPAAS